VAAIVLDLGGALLDQEEVIGEVALVDQVLALRHRHLVDPGGELAPPVVRERCEERYGLEPLCVHCPP
jgi:hypothetical protein